MNIRGPALTILRVQTTGSYYLPIHLKEVCLETRMLLVNAFYQISKYNQKRHLYGKNMNHTDKTWKIFRTLSLYKMYIREGWHPILRKPLYERLMVAQAHSMHTTGARAPDGADTLAPLPSPPAPQPAVPGIPGISIQRHRHFNNPVCACHSFWI